MLPESPPPPVFSNPASAFLTEVVNTTGRAVSSADRFATSLIGFLVHYFRANPGPHSFDSLVTKIEPVLPTLRRTDGSEYSESPDKAILGCLNTAGVFECERGWWSLNEDKAVEYERRMVVNLEQKEKRKKITQRKQACVRVRNKRALRGLTLGDRLSAHLQSLAPSVEQQLLDPLPNIHCTESIKSLRRKLGKDQFAGLMQGFAFFSSYFAQLYPGVMLRKKRKNGKEMVREMLRALVEVQNLLEQ